MEKPWITAGAVSYTHLDVYKRQGVDGQGHKKGPDDIVADGLQHQTEGDADGQLSHQHRHGGRKGSGKGAAAHTKSPHCKKVKNILCASL